jgi:DNA-binding transcriptional MerR regulator
MCKETHLLIGDVVRKTGLTERTLRFYEERALIAPIRTSGGHRAYSSGDLIRISHVVLLRRLGFSLSRIEELIREHSIDALSLIDMQLETLRAERARAENAIGVLSATRSELSDGQPFKLETLCDLIRLGEQKMTSKAWQKIYDKYYTADEQEDWKAAKEKMASDVEPDDYHRRWRELAQRIGNALPLDPTSERAASFLKEWNSLLEPFLAIANDQMKAGARRLWANMDDWSGEVDSPISKEVWAFMTDVGRLHAQKRGG